MLAPDDVGRLDIQPLLAFGADEIHLSRQELPDSDFIPVVDELVGDYPI